MNAATRRIVAIVLLVVGSIGLCCGIFPALFLPAAFDTDLARVERLEPLSFAAFEDGAPGREALIEGTLSARNRASPEGFIVYTRSVPGVDSSGNRTWREVEAVRPPLLIDVPGGLVRVVGNYTLNGTVPSTVEEPAFRISGLRAGDAVIAVGTLVEGREGVELQADLLGVGTRAAFLADNRATVLFLRFFGWTLLAGGVLMFAAGLLLLIRLLTAPHAPSSYP